PKHFAVPGRLAVVRKPRKRRQDRRSTKFCRKNYARMNSRNKPNGHGALLANGASSATISSTGMGRAASDDASDLSVANATASSAAAGAERDAYADVAPKRGDEAPKEASAAKPLRTIRPGREPLPVDGEAFVDAVHAKVDLVQLEVQLLRSKDAK